MYKFFKAVVLFLDPTALDDFFRFEFLLKLLGLAK